jgi:hypothetical protein
MRTDARMSDAEVNEAVGHHHLGINGVKQRVG